jgi:chromosome segregation protein
MGKLKSVEELFKGRHFDREIVILCVRWYLRFKLSLRDLVEMMAERGLSMAIRPLCAGCSATPRSSRNAGDGLPGRFARLRRGIATLDHEMRRRLAAAFERMNGHFAELFTRLFGGGKAQLALVEGDDPLAAGLEIMASPPGKKLQSLTLLSGGEQALTALALLFAAFLTNPTPICVLDEVDAPLDDANVDRFCKLVGEIADTAGTRFLLVTHHRITMARVDRLFGVTMAEHGVSQLVSVDLAGASRLRKTA